jgi:hypothetical protein
MKRRKTLYPLLWLLLLLCTGCRNDDLLPGSDTKSGEEGEEVTLTFGVEIPEEAEAYTRAFGEKDGFNPTQAKLMIVAFDNNHLLTNVYEGEYTTEKPAATSDYTYTNSTCNFYTVTLKTTDSPRYFHIIVNHNTLKADQIPFGTESDVFNSDCMIVNEGEDVYWARVELDKVDETTAKTALRHVKLIRNFCKISLKLNWENSEASLEDVEWGLMVIPTKGTVAPYIQDQDFAKYWYNKDGAVANPYDSDVTTANYKQLNKQEYHGHIPRTALNKDTFYRLATVDDATVDKIKWQSDAEPLYCFENEGSSGSSLWASTKIMLRGHYKENKNATPNEDYTYFRVALVDATNAYMTLNMLRNISYVVEINKISTQGYETPAEAFSRAAGNNLSGSTVTSDIPAVTSDDSSLRVEYVTKYILDNQPFTMLYRYVPDVNSTDTNGAYTADNNNVKLYENNGAYAVTELTDGTFSKDNEVLTSYTIATEDTQTNYRSVTFTPKTPDTGERSKTTTVRVQVAGKAELYRDVTFVLRERYKMENMDLYRDDTKVEGGKNDCFTLTVDIPANMPKELFPLDFTFEAKPAVVYPNVEKSIMEVNGTHPSIFDSTSSSSFHYHRAVRRVAYDNVLEEDAPGGFREENGYKKISFFFKLNTAQLNATGGTIKLGVYCPTFSPDPDDDVAKATPQALEMEYTYAMDKDGTYTLTPVKTTTDSSSN